LCSPLFCSDTTLFMPLPASVLGLMCSFLGDTAYTMCQDVVATLSRSTNLDGDKVLNIPSGMTLTSHSAIFAKIIHIVFELA
jgi:hypothetical protein